MRAADQSTDQFNPDEPRASRQDQRAINSTAELLEGEDFYREGASIVFTASYLKRRGHCCDSGCRHCPYKTE